ncbi:hypothetical protein IW262DRAFT_1543598, partial [Armillaria fumosa]
ISEIQMNTCYKGSAENLTYLCYHSELLPRRVAPYREEELSPVAIHQWTRTYLVSRDPAENLLILSITVLGIEMEVDVQNGNAVLIGNVRTYTFPDVIFCPKTTYRHPESKAKTIRRWMNGGGDALGMLSLDGLDGMGAYGESIHITRDTFGNGWSTQTRYIFVSTRYITIRRGDEGGMYVGDGCGCSADFAWLFISAEQFNQQSGEQVSQSDIKLIFPPPLVSQPASKTGLMKLIFSEIELKPQAMELDFILASKPDIETCAPTLRVVSSEKWGACLHKSTTCCTCKGDFRNETGVICLKNIWSKNGLEMAFFNDQKSKFSPRTMVGRRTGQRNLSEYF